MTTGEWANNCKSVLQALIDQQAKELPEDQRPSMAYMSVATVAQLRHETEEQALAWLTSNPKCEDHGGMWLVRL